VERLFFPKVVSLVGVSYQNGDHQSTMVGMLMGHCHMFVNNLCIERLVQTCCAIIYVYHPRCKY
jgi:hypothetical protein